jgi:hypothetical protein
MRDRLLAMSPIADRVARVLDNVSTSKPLDLYYSEVFEA